MDAWRQRYDTLGWHDHLLAAGSCQSLRYNARNTDDPKDIEWPGSKPASTNTARDVRLKQSTLDDAQPPEWVERTNACRRQDCGLRAGSRLRPRPPRTSVLALNLLDERSPTTVAETIQAFPSSTTRTAMTPRNIYLASRR